MSRSSIHLVVTAIALFAAMWVIDRPRQSNNVHSSNDRLRDESLPQPAIARLQPEEFFGSVVSIQFSPDGRWVAFTSDESGSYEVYLAPLSHPNERTRVSNAGGSRPRWRRDGREFFYLAGDRTLMSVSVRVGAKAEIGPPQSLFPPDPAGWLDYDVSTDGTKFLFIVNAAESRSGHIDVMTSWLAESPGK